MRTLAEIVPLRTAACRDAEAAIVAVAAGEGEADPAATAHVAVCLRCQAEVAAYRRVMAVMHTMRADRRPLPAGALAAAIETVHAEPLDGGREGGEGVPPWAVRVAYVGGITAASAAGMLVWLSRRRPGLLHAS
jgi:hypothetical protein